MKTTNIDTKTEKIWYDKDRLSKLCDNFGLKRRYVMIIIQISFVLGRNMKKQEG